jgi:hypothetical protein
MKEKIIYEAQSTRVPKKAHQLISKVAKKKNIRISEAYVDAATDLAKKERVKL